MNSKNRMFLKAALVGWVALAGLAACDGADYKDNRTDPVNQSEKSEDVKVTADIRKAVMDDKSLSTMAKNCKIVTANNVVTLSGEVETLAEKDSIQAKAVAHGGANRIENLLTVKSTPGN